MELFPWLVTLYDVWKNLDEEVVAASSLVGMAELLKTGCTTCFDHHYVFPARAGDLIGAQFRAAELVGMRFHASRGSMDLSRKDGGLPPDSVVQTIDQILADSERLVRVWHDPSRFSMRQVALAPCSPFSVSTDLLRESARLARSLEVRLPAHSDGGDGGRLPQRHPQRPPRPHPLLLRRGLLRPPRPRGRPGLRREAHRRYRPLRQ